MKEGIYGQASATQNANGSMALSDLRDYQSLAVDINVTALTGTNPTVTFFYERKGNDGVWYPVWSPAAVAAPGVIGTSIGPDYATAQLIGREGRIRWVLGGTGGPTATFSISVSAFP